MDIDYLKDKKVAVLGLGVEGVALAIFLVGKVSKITLLDAENLEILQKRAGEEKNPELAKILNDENTYDAVLGENYMDSLTDFDIVFRTPGVPYLNAKIQEAIKHGVEFSSQIKLFFDLCPAKVIGVTGTKGKGTTSSLIKSILDTSGDRKIHLAGNIGKSAIVLLDKIDSEDIVILELSSFQLQDLHKSPAIAVITNLSVDHLDYHSDEEEYREAKKSIFKFQNEDDWLIVNSNIDPEYYSGTKSKALIFSGFGENEGEARVAGNENKSHEVFLEVGDKNERVVSADEIKLVGDHNLENIAAAALVARSLNINIENIRESVSKFESLPHRLEMVSEIDGVRYFNDSFATNPEPTMAAIKAFSEDKVLILGGSSKGADFFDLAAKIASSNVTGVILIGDESSKIENMLNRKKYAGAIEKAEDLRDVIEKAKETTKTGDVVIFSPACASFDMFKNYKDRGDKFREAVNCVR